MAILYNIIKKDYDCWHVQCSFSEICRRSSLAARNLRLVSKVQKSTTKVENDSFPKIQTWETLKASSLNSTAGQITNPTKLSRRDLRIKWCWVSKSQKYQQQLFWINFYILISRVIFQTQGKSCSRTLLNLFLKQLVFNWQLWEGQTLKRIYFYFRKRELHQGQTKIQRIKKVSLRLYHRWFWLTGFWW